MINKKFSDALSAAFESAEALQKLFALASASDDIILRDDDIGPRLILGEVIKANKGLKQSIAILESLKRQIDSGMRPSGLRCDTISEELFTQACKSGQLRLSLSAMVDNVAPLALELLHEVVRSVYAHTSEIEEADRLHKNSETVAPTDVDETAEADTAVLISPDEVEARRAATA